MSESKPDGVVKANGLVSEFRLLYQHPNSPDVYRIVTAAGECYAYGRELTWSGDAAWESLTPKQREQIRRG